MLRKFAAIATVVIFLIGGIPGAGIILFIRLFNKQVADESALCAVRILMKIICKITGVKTTVIGYERIPKGEAVLYVGNHRSYFDIIVSYSLFPRPTGFVAKKELAKAPVFNMWMWLLKCLFLDRKNIREGMKTILAGIELMKAGHSLVIFPEGTRNMGENLTLPFHEGSMKLAAKSGCKIVPMVQCNTAACYENNNKRVKPAHTVIEFGEPIDPNALSKEDKKFLGAYVQKVIEDIYVKNLPLV